jgi:hypothetical protein
MMVLDLASGRVLWDTKLPQMPDGAATVRTTWSSRPPSTATPSRSRAKTARSPGSRSCPRSGVLNSHVTVGRIVVALELLVLVTALVGWWGDWYEITISTALLVVGMFQALFAKDIGSSSEVHALHGLLALAVFALAWSTLVRTRAEVRTVGAA